VQVFSYKISRDYGFAPNPFHGVCTLATCKPKIRKSATPGDIIVGCGSSGNKLAGRVIYVLRVSGKCSFQEYWDTERFAAKRPAFKANLSRAYGDNIYHHDAEGRWVQERSHHSFADGTVNEDNLSTDTSSDNVLWGEEFSYFGRDPPPIPDHLRAFEGQDLYPSTRDYRVFRSDSFFAAVDAWFRTELKQGCLGRPAAWT